MNKQTSGKCTNSQDAIKKKQAAQEKITDASHVLAKDRVSSAFKEVFRPEAQRQKTPFREK